MPVTRQKTGFFQQISAGEAAGSLVGPICWEANFLASGSRFPFLLRELQQVFCNEKIIGNLFLETCQQRGSGISERGKGIIQHEPHGQPLMISDHPAMAGRLPLAHGNSDRAFPNKVVLANGCSEWL